MNLTKNIIITIIIIIIIIMMMMIIIIIIIIINTMPHKIQLKQLSLKTRHYWYSYTWFPHTKLLQKPVPGQIQCTTYS